MNRCLRVGLLAALPTAFTGCGSVVERTSPDSPDWVWHCEANTEGKWDCQRVQLVDNRLPSHLNKPVAAPSLESPQLNDNVIEPPVVVEPEPVVIEQVPIVLELPDPEPAEVDEEVAEPQLSEDDAAPDAAPLERAALEDRGFYLQLAAFSQQSAIDRFIDEHQLVGDGLDRHYVLSNGQYWHVLTEGHYASRRDAMEAVDRLSIENPDLAPWVRSARSLKEAVEAAR